MSTSKSQRKHEALMSIHTQLERVGYFGDVSTNYKGGEPNTVTFNQRVPLDVAAERDVKIIIVQLPRIKPNGRG